MRLKAKLRIVLARIADLHKAAAPSHRLRMHLATILMALLSVVAISHGADAACRASIP